MVQSLLLLLLLLLSELKMAVMIILFNNSSEPGPYLGGAARMAFYLQPVVLFAAMAWPDSPALITDLSLKFNYNFFFFGNTNYVLQIG
ncbi:hypothetical protein ABFX02_11G035000 [Erythranthe guttata]